MASNEYVITSEAEAWDLLGKAVDGEGIPDGSSLRFKGWPDFKMSVTGKDWNSSVPTRIMSPFLDVQKDLHRAYAEVRYGDANLRRLKEEERDQLEIVVKVDKGSSLFNAELWRHYTEIARIAFGKMNGTEAVITVLGLALIAGGTLSFRAWINMRQRHKQLEQTVELSQEETKRMGIFAKALEQRPILQEAQNDSVESENRLLKTVKPDDAIQFKGVDLKGPQAIEIAQPERATAEDVHVSGVFRLLGNRTDKVAGFRITVQRVTDDLILQADVPLDLNPVQKAAIQEAEWNKTKLELAINGSILRGRISHAVVISASAHSDSAANDAASQE